MRYVFAILTDAVFLAYAYAAATALRVYQGAPVETFNTLQYAAVPFLVVHVVALALMEGYDFTKTRSESDIGFSAALGIVLATLLCFAISSAFITYYAPAAQVVPRSVFLIAILFELLTLAGWRIWYTRQRRRRGELRTRVLVVGPAKRVEAVGEELTNYSRSGHDILGYVSMEAQAPKAFLGAIDDLARLVEEHEADELLLLGEGLLGHSDRLLNVVRLVDDLGVQAHILPGFYETMVGKLDLYEIGGLPIIKLRRDPISLSYGYVKRAMDVSCAVAGLVLSLPLLAVAAAAIKLTSPGRIFYTQARVGLRGREFMLFKLRTMRPHAEKETGPVWATPGDPRVTPVGRFLRRKRIDEIPQLWNVLKGDMSLVGPRPERAYFMEQFSREIPLFPLRLRVKPGLTSLSHVWGRYDSAPADRLRYDLVYMSNASLMLDIRILVETIKIVLTGRGAQ